MIQWYRRHVSGWVSMAIPNADRRWNYGVSFRHLAIQASGATNNESEALEAADALVPPHPCSSGICGEWRQVTRPDLDGLH